MSQKFRTISLIIFAVLSVCSIFFATKIKGEFNFEQFFPVGDPDLEYFYQFIEEFETDDNFLFIAIDHKKDVFEKYFLNQFHQFSLECKKLPFVISANSITQLKYPQKTPFGIIAIPAVHRNDTTKYQKDKKQLLEDERFVGTLISEDATSVVLALKLKDNIQINDSRILMNKMDSLIHQYQFKHFHYLGRPNFQVEFINLQFREIIISAIISGLLVALILFLIFRTAWGVFISIISIGMGMLLFLGMLGISGRPLNLMAALYPVLLIIVGTSDVIHMMSKYIDELNKGLSKNEAIKNTIKEIGIATLLTSVTTAVGFLTLLSSKVIPIRSFGINAALGVLIAYVTVLFFTTSLLTFFKSEQIIKLNNRKLFWKPFMEWLYQFTKNNPRKIALGMLFVIVICGIGISLITTNYSIESNLPKGQKITKDYIYFEKNYAGFRPFEIAVIAKDTFKATDYLVLKEIDKVEQHLKQYNAIRSSHSITSIYKSIHRAFHQNKVEDYKLPSTEKEFIEYQKFSKKIPQISLDILVSKDEKKARISNRILDVGSDTIKAIGKRIDEWMLKNTNNNIVEFKRTGTGILFDKNEEYIRDSILYGLGFAMIAVCLLMGLLFKSWKMIFISLIPNIFPLLIAAALLGFTGIELESGVAIVFAIVFGIAVDDTIHFLSKYKILRNKGYSIDDSLHITFLETGKAIGLTSIILFFGFLVLLFSINPPSVTIGIIISVTLASALFSDLFTIPVLIRWFLKK